MNKPLGMNKPPKAGMNKQLGMNNRGMNNPGMNNAGMNNAGMNKAGMNNPVMNKPPGPPVNTEPILEVSNSSNNTPVPLTGGSKKQIKKQRKNTKKKHKGGGIFNTVTGFLGLGEKKEESFNDFENTVPTVKPIETVTLVREDLKTLKDFRQFMEGVNKKSPKDMIKDGSIQKLKGTPVNFSKKEECSAKGDDKLNRKIMKNNTEAFGEYIENYTKMNTHYKTSKEEIKSILLKLISTSKSNSKYKLKEISSDELLVIESETRKTLLNYYTNCQQLFKDGFNSLVDGVDKFELLKKKAKRAKY